MSDNYRGMTLSHVISKLFESVLINMFSQYLSSDSLQFGFKNNSSCSHAVFTLRTVINHYVKSGSTVTLCALDISETFNRADRYALLNLLMDRHICQGTLLVFSMIGLVSAWHACGRGGQLIPTSSLYWLV